MAKTGPQSLNANQEKTEPLGFIRLVFVWVAFFGACLDVCSGEPKEKTSSLRGYPRFDTYPGANLASSTHVLDVLHMVTGYELLGRLSGSIDQRVRGRALECLRVPDQPSDHQLCQSTGGGVLKIGDWMVSKGNQKETPGGSPIFQEKHPISCLANLLLEEHGCFKALALHFGRRHLAGSPLRRCKKKRAMPTSIQLSLVLDSPKLKPLIVGREADTGLSQKGTPKKPSKNMTRPHGSKDRKGLASRTSITIPQKGTRAPMALQRSPVPGKPFLSCGSPK